MIAVSSALLSIGILRYAWRRPVRQHALMVSGGWATAIVSMILYARACGAEVGVPFALAAFNLGGIAAVLGNIEIRTPKKRDARERSTPPAESRSSPLTVVLRTLSVGLLAALAAWGFGLGIRQVVHVARNERVAVQRIRAAGDLVRADRMGEC